MQPSESWASGAAYEPYVGRWSRLVAADFIQGLGIPAQRRWLDVGCGTGALSATILAMAQPASVRGVDRSAEFVAYARTHVVDARVTFEAGDAQSLPLDDASCDVAVSALALNFFPDPVGALREMARCTGPRGVVAAYLWDYGGRMQMLRHFWNAAANLDATARDLDEGRRFPICQPDALHSAFVAAGLSGVQTRPIDVSTVFRDFDDYWVPFLGGQGPAPSYVRSLTDAQCAGLRERLRRSLPTALDGSIALIARAWTARGMSA
ncbi:MAG: class I SAM-dependent methyltransferase [Gemmatimonadaceae bacterium]